MRITNRAVCRIVAALVVAAGFGRAGAAEDDSALRQKALLLNAVTGNSAMSGNILALVKDKAGGKKVVAVAARMLKDKGQAFNPNALFILARAAQGFKNYDASEAFYRDYIVEALKLRSSQKVANGYSGLVSALFAAKKLDECEKECRKFIEMEEFDDPDVLEEDADKRRTNHAITDAKNLIFRQMIVVLVRQDKANEAMKILNNIIKAQPDNFLNLELKGRVLREIGKLDEAAKVYEKTLDTILKDDRFTKPEREEFADDVRYALSGVYVDLKQIDKAAAQLKKLIEREPDNPTYNNDLGFIWADHGMNLDESEKLIRKALEDDKKQRLKENPELKPAEYKDNPSYLDSLGWVLFKKKQYAEAKKYLLLSVKGEDDDGQNLEIYDHLAEVYLAMGEKAEAIKAWKKGLEHATTSKRDKERKIEVEKKIKANE